jgi:hypothetical protein
VSLHQQLERLTDAYLAGVVPLAEYQRRRSDLERRQQELEQQARQLEAQADRQSELAMLANAAGLFCERVRQGLAGATFEQKRALVELLIDRVIVTDGEVEIRYVMPTARTSEQVRFCHLRLDYRARPPRDQAAGATDARVQVLPVSRADACRRRTHAHDPQRPVAADGRNVSGTAILFVGRIKPVISIGIVCPPRKFAAEPAAVRSHWSIESVPQGTRKGVHHELTPCEQAA